MDTKKHLIDLVCKGYCKFYKESKNEELACEGFRFFERLISSPTDNTTPSPPLSRGNSEKSNPPVFQHDSILMDILCKKCDFLIDGCDYRDEKYHANASPCGGFILLHRIIEEQKT
jgi:hypothetical protein